MECSSIAKNIKNLNITNFKTNNCKSLSEMFSHCEKLEYLDLNNFNTEKVVYMNSIFNGCKNLKSINGL